MDFSKIKSVYLIGIGGIGMSALARYFNALGKKVAGYDKTPTALTAELINENIAVHFDDDVKQLPAFLTTENPSTILIIYTPAIPKDHREYNFLKTNFTLYKRSQILGFITQNTNTIAVAGTHGKTTTSSIVTHLLHSNGKNVSAFLGGIAKNINTNFLLGDVQKANHITVVEADEYDRSFLTLHPQVAIITSMDADHLDIYGDHQTLIDCYKQFANQVGVSGSLIIKSGLEVTAQAKVISYSITENAKAIAKNISVENGNYVFDYLFENREIKNVQLGLAGRHNIENAVAAVTAVIQYDLSDEQITKGLSSYTGVKRRYDVQVKNENVIYIDDYAHHPEELNATILSVKELYPDKKLTVIFQPHLFTRTRDFANDFAAALSLPDETILLPIYPARELPIEGVDANMICQLMTNKKMICEKKDLLNVIAGNDIEVLLTLGAGDIDQFVAPIKTLLNSKYVNK